MRKRSITFCRIRKDIVYGMCKDIVYGMCKDIVYIFMIKYRQKFKRS